jgi:hypothetical protein
MCLYALDIFKSPVTTQCGQVVDCPVLYSGVLVQILAQRPAILTEVFCGFPQSLWANTRIVP